MCVYHDDDEEEEKEDKLNLSGSSWTDLEDNYDDEDCVQQDMQEPYIERLDQDEDFDTQKNEKSIFSSLPTLNVPQMFEDIKAPKMFEDIKMGEMFENIKAPEIFKEDFLVVDSRDRLIMPKIENATENIKENLTSFMNNGQSAFERNLVSF